MLPTRSPGGPVVPWRNGSVTDGCQVCGGPWTLRRGHLHHRCYDRIGHERFGDLIPLDRHCHDRLHRILESTPAWRRMNRAQATGLIVALLRRRNHDNPSQP